jgi:phospholipase/lecithinase/hemolysin
MFVNNELALDGQHPGKQAHKEMAEKMFEIISKPQ